MIGGDNLHRLDPLPILPSCIPSFPPTGCHIGTCINSSIHELLPSIDENRDHGQRHGGLISEVSPCRRGIFRVCGSFLSSAIPRAVVLSGPQSPPATPARAL